MKRLSSKFVGLFLLVAAIAVGFEVALLLVLPCKLQPLLLALGYVLQIGTLPLPRRGKRMAVGGLYVHIVGYVMPLALAVALRLSAGMETPTRVFEPGFGTGTFLILLAGMLFAAYLGSMAVAARKASSK